MQTFVNFVSNALHDISRKYAAIINQKGLPLLFHSDQTQI